MDHNRMGEASGIFLGFFYANEGMVGSIDSEWLQKFMDVLFGLFQQYGRVDNFAKPRTMTCQPGALRSGMSEEDKDLKCRGVGDSYLMRLRRQISCPECGAELTAG